MPSIGKIAAYVVGGAAFVGLSGYGYRKLIKVTVAYSPQYNQAMDYLYKHEESKKLLGEPIEQKGFMNIGDKKFFGEYKQYKYYTIPVQGSKLNGNLTYWIKDMGVENNKDNNNNKSNNEDDMENTSRYEVKKVLLEVLTKPRQLVWVKNDNKA